MNKPSTADILRSADKAMMQVRTRSLDISFNEILDMYENKELIISPAYQRLFRWPESKQSQFIESLILELPIPPIYVIESQDGEYELIDGLQRVSSYLHLRGIANNEQTDDNEDQPTLIAEPKTKNQLIMQGCDVIPELNGLTYDTLPRGLQIKLKRNFIRMEILRKEADNKLKYHMFKRLNTGGEKLSDQEIRNCTIRLLSEDFNNYLIEKSKNSNYRTCMAYLTDRAIRRMGREEYVLRFFAFKNNGDNYVKNIAEFLTEYMEAASSPESTFNIESESDIFDRTFKILADSLGKSSFSMLTSSGTNKNQHSALIFDSITIGIQDHLDSLEKKGNKFTKDLLTKLKKDSNFKKLTTGGGKNHKSGFNNRTKYVSDFIASRV